MKAINPFDAGGPAFGWPLFSIGWRQELEKITLLVDALSEEEGFILCSVTFDFSEPSEQVARSVFEPGQVARARRLQKTPEQRGSTLLRESFG